MEDGQLVGTVDGVLGIVTGVLLGLARIIGQTAPLILGPYTKDIATNLFGGLMPTLPTMVTNDSALQTAVDRVSPP